MLTICVSPGWLQAGLDPVPDDVRVIAWDMAGDRPEGVQTTRFWVPGYLSGTYQDTAYAAMPDLQVIQLLSAGADAYVSTVPPGVTLCDAQGVHGSSTSEWVLAATLCALREFPRFVRAQSAGRWDQVATDELSGKRVLVVGAGDLGTQVARRMSAFDAESTLVARTARDGVHAVSELCELLPLHDVVVLVIPLTPATTGLVDAGFLARMRDGALLVNAARGPVADTDALVAELSTGRISAVLDVTDPEPLPAGHPLWSMPNVLITPHVGGNVTGFPVRAARLVREQLDRFRAGAPLHNVVSDGY